MKEKNLLRIIKSTAIQFIKYIFVGGIAFIADAAALWFFSKFVHYLISAAAAFILGLVVNFIMSKLIVFKTNKVNKVVEFAVYAVIGVIGLFITEILMYILTDKAGIYFMLSKIITAAIILVWNFAARKMILYRSEDT